jgi:alpha-tubulin suppressor-like RCC1 family protein
MGHAHTCLLLDTGKVRCWGDDHQGQLGAKRASREPTTVPVDDVDLE